jgi:nucleotide-binding universal stress UspA family protein
MRSILVPVDLSEATPALVAWSAALAERLGCRLWLLHVAAPDPAFVGYTAGPESVRAQRAATLRKEHRALQEHADALRERGIDACALLVQRPTVEGILAEAASLGADLIVMGSHGRGAVARALVGSASQGVLRGARCPVTIVPCHRER